MFELSIAAKYLTPRWRQLSVSIISLISIMVIAMVVWLIIVFFSVTNGLTSNWVEKLIGLTAPVRITPTEEYYHSYYYLVDGISDSSDYTLKTISEKRDAPTSDPYNTNYDEEIPLHWPEKHLAANGTLIDPVKTAFHLLQNHGYYGSDFELTMANLRVRLLRQAQSTQKAQSFLNQAIYISSLDPANALLPKTILPYSPQDIGNILRMSTVAADQFQEDAPDRIFKASVETIRDRLRIFFSHASISAFRTPPQGLKLPYALIPEAVHLQAFALYRHKRLVKVMLPLHKQEGTLNFDGFISKPAMLVKRNDTLELTVQGEAAETLNRRLPIMLVKDVELESELIPESFSSAMDPSHLRFHIHFLLQGHHVAGNVSLGNLEISQAKLETVFNDEPQKGIYWLHQVNGQLIFPSSSEMGEGILLPKSFRDAGAYVGDIGALSYFSPTISSLQEQRAPIYISGFYDPGILPMGGKFILANKELTNLIRTSQGSTEALVTNGINVRFPRFEDASLVKQQLQQAFAEAGIAPYWKIETYKEFEFTKDILQQLDSEKRLFSMLAAIIIIVACSNIISMLIILVNDKKIEIGILRSMGATSFSIALIFGSCGIVMGLAGSLIGTLAAFITLKNLPVIVTFISQMQGQEMFNPIFYGDTLPTTISFEAFFFVMTATIGISLVSGLVPAIKACLMQPSAILKAE